MLEHDAKDWNALIEVTDRMLRLDSIDYPLAHFLKAAGHYNLGEYEEAEKGRAGSAGARQPQLPADLELLGWTSIRQQNDVAAIGQFEQYVKSMPGGADAPAVHRALEHLIERHPDCNTRSDFRAHFPRGCEPGTAPVSNHSQARRADKTARGWRYRSPGRWRSAKD